MNINAATLSKPDFRSLTDWLVLAGVSIEINNHAASYVIAMPEMPAGTMVEEATKPLAQVVVPVARHTIETFNTLNDLNKFCETWKELGLAKTASRAVLGSGKHENPMVMVICDIPDDNEDRQGLAFSSPAGRLVRQALTQAGIAEENIYFSYLSKWRTPAKRALTTVERDICTQILIQEIGLVKPDMILTLGESTIKALDPAYAQNLGKNTKVVNYKNQYLSNNIPLKASQKGEFLVKNPLMKKSFWFSLLDLADTIRAQGSHP